MLKLHRGYGPFEVAFSDSKLTMGDYCYKNAKYTIHGVWVPKDKYDIKYKGQRYLVLFPNTYICSVFCNSSVIGAFAIVTKNKIRSLQESCSDLYFYNTQPYICMPFKRLEDDKLRDQAKRYALNYMSSTFTDSDDIYLDDNNYPRIIPSRIWSTVKHKISRNFAEVQGWR